MEKKRVLILCTGNSARSQMAECLLRHDAGETFNVESAGTNATTVRSEAIAAMRELEIDISGQRAKNVAAFEGPKFDYVIIVCDNARQTCPVFFGASKKLHHSLMIPHPLRKVRMKKVWPSFGAFEMNCGLPAGLCDTPIMRE